MRYRVREQKEHCVLISYNSQAMFASSELRDTNHRYIHLPSANEFLFDDFGRGFIGVLHKEERFPILPSAVEQLMTPDR